MRKLYFAAICLFVSASVSAQSLTATNVYLSGDPLVFLEGHATITNVSSSTKDVLVERTVNNLTAGHISYFCWAQCYSPVVSLAPDTIQLAPGADTDLFRGDIETNSISGFSFVTYCFFDANNVSDSVCVEYIYDATTGLADVNGSKNYISKAYPNPAIDNTNIYYSLARNTRSAQIKIFNMLGAEVKNYQLSDSKGTLKITVTGMKPGVYFYSLVADGKSTASGKFMITKN